MKLLPTESDEESLLRLGREAVALLEKRDFRAMAERYGYALAFGQDPATAIEEELRASIEVHQTSAEKRTSVPHSTTVKYFSPNDSNLFALVECIFVAEGCPVLVELIVTKSGGDLYVTLEQISPG